MLTIRLLGELQVLASGQQTLTLPPSKKTRALLAYLAVTGRPQRRERLCDLFWDVPDDPRGALRWSLSRLRSVLDEPGMARLLTDRETVAMNSGTFTVDLLTIQSSPERATPKLERRPDVTPTASEDSGTRSSPGRIRERGF